MFRLQKITLLKRCRNPWSFGDSAGRESDTQVAIEAVCALLAYKAEKWPNRNITTVAVEDSTSRFVMITEEEVQNKGEKQGIMVVLTTCKQHQDDGLQIEYSQSEDEDDSKTNSEDDSQDDSELDSGAIIEDQVTMNGRGTPMVRHWSKLGHKRTGG